MFADFEIEFFDQSCGLEQECVLYQNLFSILMKELVNMLKQKHWYWTGFSGNCLLSVYDIVLLGKSEADFQALLNITADFATKGNLKFSAGKSKVMVIGKRIDNHKQYSLRSDVLKETNEYKYLGVYFARCLSFSYHIIC